MFENRRDAGRQLAGLLLKLKIEEPVVIALPRGGVPVAAEIAAAFAAPLDVLMVRKLGFPGQPDLAIGAIADGDRWEMVQNTEFFSEADFPVGYLKQEIDRKLDEIRKMEAAFRGHRPSVDLAGRTAIAVDDGIATGATFLVMLRRLKRDKPGRIIVASPVASLEAVRHLEGEADQIVCVEVPPVFRAVSRFYGEFNPVSDDEVIGFLERNRERYAKVT